MIPLPPGHTPRPWQLRALDACRAAMPRYSRVIVSAATGTGKGSLIAGIAILRAQRGGRVLLLAHREELVSELEARIRKVKGAPSVGVVQASRDEWLNPIVVASVQSCTPKRLENAGAFDLILVDEAHHAVAKSYVRIFALAKERKPELKIIGFTATPFRTGKDGGTSGLGAVFEAVVFEYGIADAIGAGDLVPLRAFQVSTELDLSTVKVGVDGDFEAGDLGRLIDTPARNDLVVAQYQERANGRPALAFAATVEHAQHIAEAFKAKGINAEAVWGDMPKDRRRFLIQAFREHPDHLPVLVSRDLIFEGFDAPKTALILKARPTKSALVFTQMVGRGLRLAPGKSECIFVDLIDDGANLGLATAADLTNDGDLDGAKKREIQAGDHVRRRHHDDYGIGLVHDVVEGAIRMASVEWPPSKVHAHGQTSTHPVPELRYIPATQLGDEEGEQLLLTPTVANVHAYEIFLLPGQRKSDRVGWYQHADTWSASGELRDGTRLAMLARRVGKRTDTGAEAWEVWERRSAPDHQGDRTTRVHQSGSRDLALAWADAHLKAAAAKVAKVDADWKVEPATDRQRSALAKWGIRRDTSEMSKGEASALLDAVVTLRRISEVEDPGKAERAQRWRERWREDGQQQGGAA